MGFLNQQRKQIAVGKNRESTTLDIHSRKTTLDLFGASWSNESACRFPNWCKRLLRVRRRRVSFAPTKQLSLIMPLILPTSPCASSASRHSCAFANNTSPIGADICASDPQHADDDGSSIHCDDSTVFWNGNMTNSPASICHHHGQDD